MKGGIVLTLFGVCIVALLGGLLWPYTINTWLIYCGKEAAVVFWQGALIGFVPFVGQLMIPAAILTWVIMLFI